jgi:hopene-associated glycosyltransferase HpnB
MFELIATLVACCAWAYLLWGQGNFWHIILPQPPLAQPKYWPSVTIIVPARNEASMMPLTLPGLLGQDYPGDWQVIVVDDHSTDGTAQTAYKVATTRGQEALLQVIQPPPLPADWRGKVHAMHWGVQAAGASDYYLFTDADIFHQPSSLRFLVTRSLFDQLDLHSLMVKLRCESVWEKMLVPAFVYFFQMLYPFSWSNTPGMRIAAAAGGVMLVHRPALDAIGGLAAIKGALIDDCALARAIKFRPAPQPPRTLITLVDHEVVSLRAYNRLGSLWGMISRSAFTQLRYSYSLLLLSLLGLGLIFFSPILLPFMGGLYALAGFVILTAMLYSYLPMVSFYRINFLWAATLPLAALIYMGATIHSAWRYTMGTGGNWKGRNQAPTTPPTKTNSGQTLAASPQK